MSHLLIRNLIAISVAGCGCFIAHVAGLKWMAWKLKKSSIVPAIVATLESVGAIGGALLVVQLLW